LVAPISQHGAAGPVPQVPSAWVIHDGADGATYGRSRPCPVSRISPRPTSAWTSTRTPSRWRSSRRTATVLTSSGSPTTRRRCAGSLAASAIPGCCEPAPSTGPTGYELARLLHSMRVGCEVIAPSLIPKAPGDRVKTDKRDCRRLARLHRAGELVAIRIPSIEEEAVRDLCRARADRSTPRSTRPRCARSPGRTRAVHSAGTTCSPPNRRPDPLSSGNDGGSRSPGGR